MTTDLSAFQNDVEYISFDASPHSSSRAGPSRITQNGVANDRTHDELDSGDERLLAAQTGKRKMNGDGRKKDKEGGKRAKGEAKGDTGPKNLKEERKAAERHAPWADMVDWERCHDPVEMLNQEITAFYRHVSPTRAEFQVRLFVIELITRAVHKLWPDAEITPFGSWQTQLYLPQGDIDLVVSTKRFSENLKAKMLGELARAMRQAYITDVVAIISKAKVPIIKFVTNAGKLNVDISLNQVNGVSAGKIINQYLEVLPGSRQLILVVKAFLSQRSMNEVYTGGLGSYAVICLVISFLQVHPKLRRSEMNPEENLGTLLIEFFELYGRNFNYDDVGISIRRGGFYYSKASRGWKRAGQTYLLSIEDPQDRDNDISGGSFGIRRVKGTLAGAYELLQGKLFERAEQIVGQRSGRYPRRMDPEEMSILSGVMGITKETTKQRREMQKLHDEGRLQRMLGIPTGADPFRHLPHHDIPLHPSSKRPADTDLPLLDSGSKRRRRRPAINAIIVDDEEVWDDEDSESAEDGEIVEVFPNGDGGVQRIDRYASVSEDEFEDEHTDIAALEEDEDESRYALWKQDEREEEDLNGSSSDSGSVIAIEPPGPKANGKTAARARREFWAAKGRREVEADDIAGGADDIGVE